MKSIVALDFAIYRQPQTLHTYMYKMLFAEKHKHADNLFMTNFEYAEKMQDLCLKLSDALKLHNEQGLSDFYKAASDGFIEMRDNYSPEEAAKDISDDQVQQIKATADYVIELENENKSEV